MPRAPALRGTVVRGMSPTSTEEPEAVTAQRSLRARCGVGPCCARSARADHRAGMRWLRSQARHEGVTVRCGSSPVWVEHGALWILIGLIGALVDPRRRAEWLRGLASVGGAYLVNTTLKQIARRPRPTSPICRR